MDGDYEENDLWLHSFDTYRYNPDIEVDIELYLKTGELRLLKKG